MTPVMPLLTRWTLRRWARSIVVLALVAAGAPRAQAQTTAQDLYVQAGERERLVRQASSHPTLADLRAAVRAYELVVRRFPRSGYCDNALWQAGGLTVLAYERFHDEADRRDSERLLRMLKKEYSASPFVARIDEQLAHLEALAKAAAPPPRLSEPSAPPTPVPPRVLSAPASAPERPRRTVRLITRQPLPIGTRVIIELDGEAEYREDRLGDPPRVFFDLQGVRLGSSLDRDVLARADDVIREIRVGQRADDTVRVVLELAAEPRYTVVALYDPYRLVIDVERRPPTAAVHPPGPRAPAAEPRLSPARPAPVTPFAADPVVVASSSAPSPLVQAPASPPVAPPLPAIPAAPAVLSAPAAPSRNADGTFSLARQLGLGVSRIVIDPGHGGHDPGAQAGSLDEADVVLDIALRLEALLQKEPGVEVVMTRRTDAFIPLEERTAIANHEGADLFLSIHANASRNRRAAGIETYYLNFATNPQAEAVAARENSASGRAKHSLPDIVQAIALNNKLDESRDLARLVQDAMIRRVRPQHPPVRSLGVKQAPFVVLIGAQMPSVLAEVSFITNKTEASLLAKPAYRQRIAQALFDALMGYQRSLKNTVAVAERPARDVTKHE
jgi:N-acetylmuramoyl-L-alanine amidase